MRLGRMVDGLGIQFLDRHDCLEHLGIHGKVVAPDAVLDYVRHRIADEIAVRATEDALDLVLLFGDHLQAQGILPVLAQIRQDVADAHHAPLQGAGTEQLAFTRHGAAFLHQAIELGEGIARSGPVAFESLLAAVTEDAIQGLQRKIAPRNGAQQAHAMNIVVEEPARAGVIQIGKQVFAAVPEGRMPQIVPEGNRLDQGGVQTQRAAQLACVLGNQLQVEGTARQVVVAVEGEDLGLVHAAVVEGIVQDTVHVPGEVGPDQGILGIACGRMLVDRLVVTGRIRGKGSIRQRQTFFKIGAFLFIEAEQGIVPSVHQSLLETHRPHAGRRVTPAFCFLWHAPRSVRRRIPGRLPREGRLPDE